ncbi:MAG: hypothetical protein GC171_08710 [Terrimonas sp.]|nr:hypothetical protein [Terrimonas sp.]
MKKIVSILLIAAVIAGCKPEKQNDFFPVLSFIQSQVKHVDTSVYAIRKITKTDSLYDTVYIKREEFRSEAADFLNIPDLTAGRYTKKYEERKNYEEDLNRASIAYYPLKKGMEITREEVNIIPTPAGNDKIRSIYIETFRDVKDSIITKKLYWQVDESFKTVTIIQKENQPDKVFQKEVIWNKPAESNE